MIPSRISMLASGYANASAVTATPCSCAAAVGRTEKYQMATAAADEHHRRVEPELPPLETCPSGQREGEERGEREERVAEVEWVGPRDGGVEMEHEQIEDGDRIADEDHRSTDGQQTQRSPDAGVEDRTPRGQRVEYQHRHVERHERHVADQVAHGRAAPSASFPEQIAEGVESGEERDSERRPPGPVADYGM